MKKKKQYKSVMALARSVTKNKTLLKGLKADIDAKKSEDRRCGTCKHWHVWDFYECQHAGPFGGDHASDTYCKWEPK